MANVTGPGDFEIQLELGLSLGGSSGKREESRVSPSVPLNRVVEKFRDVSKSRELSLDFTDLNPKFECADSYRERGIQAYSRPFEEEFNESERGSSRVSIDFGDLEIQCTDLQEKREIHAARRHTAEEKMEDTPRQKKRDFVARVEDKIVLEMQKGRSRVRDREAREDEEETKFVDRACLLPTQQNTAGNLQMPSVFVNGTNGKAATGVLYRYSKSEVTIVCLCHGTSFSAVDFVKHAGGTDLANPLRQITVIPPAAG